tara:strand:+ start:41 stop:745 length:705 start_codon:yes stop_codon:yes gene_type:complete
MSYSTNINWDLFFNQVDLIHNDKPIYIKNFLPNFQDYISWKDVNNILNNSLLNWRLIKDGYGVNIPTYNTFTGDILQDKSFISSLINKGSTFIIEKFITYNEPVKSLLNDIEAHFNISAGAHIFGSKNQPQTKSYSPHVDNDPLFIFNIKGTTKWNLYSNPTSRLLQRDEINSNVIKENLTPYPDVILHPGDFLYIPQRIYHTASPTTTDLHRLSLNVSTFLDLNPIDKNYYQI